MTYITPDAYRLARSDGPRSPFPIYWCPRIFGAALAFAGSGGSS